MEYDENCSLCRKDRLREQPYSDDICWVTVCPLHNQPMLVLNAHRAEPTLREWEHIKGVKEKLYPNLRFRGYMASMPGHWHQHLI